MCWRPRFPHSLPFGHVGWLNELGPTQKLVVEFLSQLLSGTNPAMQHMLASVVSADPGISAEALFMLQDWRQNRFLDWDHLQAMKEEERGASALATAATAEETQTAASETAPDSQASGAPDPAASAAGDDSQVGDAPCCCFRVHFLTWSWKSAGARKS